MASDPLALQTLKYGLFLKRRFWPIFTATFLGTFNDNLIRSGLVVLIAYSAMHGLKLPARPEILVTLCSALLVMPMMLFSFVAGQLADKYEKSRLVQCAKFAEVGIMTVACYGFATHNVLLLMALLFISGTHTTFYSPMKFSLLPDHLSHGELLAGNGFMAGGTYLSVLLGLIAGGLLVELPGDVIGKTAFTVACLGLLASLFIPVSSIAHPGMRINWHLWRGTKDIIFHASRDKRILLSILGLSWYTLVGSVFMSQFANYAEGTVHADNEVYILFLTVFSIGIAIGALLCDWLLKGQVSPKLTPITALLVSLFTYLLVAATPHLPKHAPLEDLQTFIAAPQHWLLLCSMLMVAMSGGVYMVPLYAMLQSHTPAEYRSRIMAASNLSDSLFMTVAALVSAGLLSVGLGITDLFLFVATLNLGVVYYARRFTA